MGESTLLKIEKREKGTKGAMHRLRKQGLLPGSISRKGSDAVSFSVDKTEFRKALGAHGLSGIYKLQMDKKTAFTAMIREIQHVPGTEDYLHVTFQSVSMTEETTADIHLHIHGRDALHHNGYELLQQLESVHLRGLPGDFPSVVNIDITDMKPGEHVTVADLQLPKGIVSETEPERLILSVAHPKVRTEETAGESAAAHGDTAQPAAGGEEAEQQPSAE